MVGLQMIWHWLAYAAVMSTVVKRGDDVLETSKALGAETQFAELLSRCDSRFEITCDLDAALNEETTLNTIRSALQRATQGVTYNTWDKQLTGPNESR